LIAAAFIIGLDATADPPRVMHHFDFDERPQGNLESIPKYWRSLRPSGFPRFSVGLLDDSVGRNAPPSFRLNGYGRNVAYAYVGSDTVIGHSGEYQVEAFIRPDRLVHARACISACFLDDHGDPLLTTLVRSRYVGGPDDPDDWIRVELLLSSVSDEARSIGIIVWLL